MFTLEKKYRDWREEVKKSCLLKYENDEDRLCNAPPPRVSPIDWAPVIASYNPDEYKEMMLTPPIKLSSIPGAARVEPDDDEVEQGIQVHAEAEPMEEEAGSEERSSCTSVNSEEIIGTAEDAHMEELTRMKRELRQQVEEDMRALRAQNVHLLQKLEEIESKCDSLAAPTQRLVPGSTPAAVDTDDNTPQIQVRSKKRSKRAKSKHEETVVREHKNGGASGSRSRSRAK